MSQCPGCGAFCFIDMEGNAAVQTAEVAEPSSHFDRSEHAEPGGAAAPTDYSDPIESIIDVPSESEAAPSSADDFGGGFGSLESLGSSTDSDAVSEDFKPFDPFEQNQPGEAVPATPDDFQPIDMTPTLAVSESTATSAPTNSGFHAGPKPITEPQDFGPASDPLNLNEFANSEVSAAKDGPLLFKILISGIDTREIRDSIREVLEDPRFAWDSNEIFSKVSKGHLTINGLSPVKASILITRIKRLPVEIRWEQYAISQGQS